MTAATLEIPYKTTDLALATFLSLNGLTLQMERIANSERVLFVFDPIIQDEIDNLNRLVDSFAAGQARVEPVKFIREVGAIRGQLYDLIDGKPRRGH